MEAINYGSEQPDAGTSNQSFIHEFGNKRASKQTSAVECACTASRTKQNKQCKQISEQINRLGSNQLLTSQFLNVLNQRGVEATFVAVMASLHLGESSIFPTSIVQAGVLHLTVAGPSLMTRACAVFPRHSHFSISLLPRRPANIDRFLRRDDTAV